MINNWTHLIALTRCIWWILDSKLS